VAAARDQPAMRRAASALYNVTSAVLLASEGARIGADHGDWSRAALAGVVARHKLMPADPLADAGSEEAAEPLIDGRPVSLDQANSLFPAA
jgi:acyl-CoA dehydrogenase